MDFQLLRLLQLGIIIIVALGAVWLLLWLSDRARTKQEDLLIGYPPNRFPVQEVVRSGPLQTLVATQARLVSIYRQLPAESDLANWLRAFLYELREIMDTTYQIRVIMQMYGQPAQLDRLILEVEEIEAQVAEQVVHKLLTPETNTIDRRAVLDSQLANLRSCVRELATMASTD